MNLRVGISNVFNGIQEEGRTYESHSNQSWYLKCIFSNVFNGIQEEGSDGMMHGEEKVL